MEEELQNVQRLSHSRKHSRSLSALSSITAATAAGGGSSSRGLKLVKIHLAGPDLAIRQSRMLALQTTDGLCYPELAQRVRSKLGIATPPKLKYRDEDGDLITICDDSDLTTALALQSSPKSPSSSSCGALRPSSDQGRIHAIDQR